MAAPKLLKCKSCGRNFIFSRSEQEFYQSMNWDKLPSLCPVCRRKRNQKRQEERDEQKRKKDDATRRERQRKEALKFDNELRNWNVVKLDDITFRNNNVLYILGNGFDMMHGVKSSYYAFRDSIGKHNSLWTDIDLLWPEVDLWADFENNLAHFDAKIMADKFIVENWLNLNDAYSVDADAGEFYLSVENAIRPIENICYELPLALRRWVDKLSIGTDDRPLKHIFVNGKVLCFNYTEFVETLYGISHENVCYIHGCRKKEKYHPKDTLIIGHLPGESNDEYNKIEGLKKEPNNFRNVLTELAQEEAIRLISEYDEELTKNSDDIINSHQYFFEDLESVENVVVIGHSLSGVDWDYFIKVKNSLKNRNNVHWYFGCHGSGDLNNLTLLKNELGLDNNQISIFRTDEIKVTLYPEKEKKPPQHRQRSFTVLSSNGRWSAKYSGGLIMISDDNLKFNFVFQDHIKNVFFESSDSLLFLQTIGIDNACYIFKLADSNWVFVNDLKPVQNQALINRRLREVVITDDKIYFFYNSRLRLYNLADGSVAANNRLRYKINGHGTVSGKNIRDKFWPKVCH